MNPATATTRCPVLPATTSRAPTGPSPEPQKSFGSRQSRTVGVHPRTPSAAMWQLEKRRRVLVEYSSQVYSGWRVREVILE